MSQKLSETAFGYVSGAFRVSTSPNRGSIGPRAHVTGFISGLRSIGVQPRTYLVGDQSWTEHIGGDGNDSGSSIWVRQCLNDLGRLGLAWVVRRQAARKLGRVDVVYERQATFQRMGRQFQRRGAFWVVESNGPFWYEASVERRGLVFSRTAKRQELTAYRQADLVVVVSQVLAEIIVKEANIDPSKVLVLPNGTDAYRFDPAAVTPDRRSDWVTLGFSGYIARWAGIDLAIDAIDRLRSVGVNVAFTIVGDGPDKTELEDSVAARRLQDRISFVGRVPWAQVPALIAGFDLGYSGQREMDIGGMYHSPQKMYEYLAMGVPIVASSHHDAETLAAAGSGWIFQSGDVNSLEKVLMEAVQDREARAARARVARQVVLDGHTWTQRVEVFVDRLRRNGVISEADQAAVAPEAGAPKVADF